MGRNGVTINFSGLDDLVKGFSRQPAVIKNEATRIINTVAGKVERVISHNTLWLNRRVHLMRKLSQPQTIQFT